MKYIEKIQKFMYGRYGIDELYRFMFYLYTLLIILNLFIKNRILTIIELIILFIMFYRMLSKKIYKRSNENQIFLKIKKKLLKPFRNIRRSIKDKEYVYKKCKYCKKLLKLPIPYKKGIKEVKCPKCKKNFKMLVLKSNKVEIISKKEK